QKLAEQHAGTPEALPALLWMIEPTAIADAFQTDAFREGFVWALARCAKDHVADPAMRRVAIAIGRQQPLVAELGKSSFLELLERVRKQGPDRDVVATATFALALTLYQPEDDDRGETDARRQELARSLTLFREMIEKYPDREETARASRYAFELEHL